MTKVLITPRSLKTPDHPALTPLRDAGYELVLPSPGETPSPDVLKQVLPGCAGWLAGVEKITADIIIAAPDLRVISRNGAGVDAIDVAAAEARGIRVMNTPGANARGVAELALALIFAVARNIPAADASIRSGGWERRQGFELEGKTLGVVGCGQIGRLVAGIGAAVGMRVAGYDLYPDASFALPGFRYAGLEELAREADVVSVHIPGGEKPVVDGAFLGRMKKGAVLVNTARASAVEAEAVLRALDAGNLFGYGVDAFDEEPPGRTLLTAHPRVVSTSHIGGFTAESVYRAAARAARNIVDVLGCG